MSTPQSKTPFLSIVIPTRDRPQLLRHVLWSVRHQSDHDFEVIVSDNHTHTPARSVFDEVVGDHPNFHYFRPDSDLNMVDNWNFAASKTSGIYVTVLEDKFALHLDCVETLKKVTKSESPEIINWYADIFYPENAELGCDKGVYLERHPKNLQPCSFEPFSVLEKRLTCDTARREQGGMYGMGKIVFGVYHRHLIERIVSRTGRLFHSFIPAYTSMTAALLLANSAIDLGRSLCVAMITLLSNGDLCQQHVKHAKKFLASYGDLDEILKQLPLQGLPTPNHNLVAHDYLTTCEKLPEQARGHKLNWSGLYLQCEKELDLVVWENDEEKKEHYQRLRASTLHFPFKHCLTLWIRNIPRLAPKRLGCILSDKTEKKIPNLEGTPSIQPGSDLWKRWNSNVHYQELPMNSAGMDTTLLYLFLRNHFSLPPNHLIEQDLSMNSESSIIPPSLTTRIQDLDPEISLLINNLVTQITENRSNQKKELDARIAELEFRLENFPKLLDLRDEHIQNLESKLEDFRGMIARRNDRIHKLEKKLGLKA